MDKRYFIIAYSIRVNGNTIIGNFGFTTENEDYINYSRIIAALKKSYKANPFDYANVTSIIEVNKKDYKRFWEE